MAKTKISEFSTTAGNNTDINSINIAEGCAPSGINDAIRELMRQLKEFQTGGAGDSVNSGGDFSVATNKFTVASASGNTAVAGTLGVTGAATLSSTLAVTGTTTLTGALVANGNATLGDGSGDTVTVKGTPTLEVNPTLSGGTANGVAYLNGSKALTSGSALTFDGSSLGVGIASPGTKVDVAGAVRSNVSGGTPIFYLSNGTTQHSIQNNSGSLAFYNDGTRGMDLTSTGLGIGTSSPGAKLDVNGSIYAGGAVALSINSSGSNYGQIGYNTGIGDVYWLGYGSSKTGSSTAVLNWNSSGNLGIGTSSIPTVGSTTVLAVGNSNGGTLGIVQSGSIVYRVSASTSGVDCYNPNASPITWYTNGSERMRLDASGNLGIGTSSYANQAKLQIAGGRSYFGSNDSVYAVHVAYSNTRAQAGQGYYIGATDSTTPSLVFSNNDGTERARIDSSGNLLVGTTSVISNSKIYIKGELNTVANGIGIETTETGTSYLTTYYKTGTGLVGSITYNGTLVAYNATSDYRLKNVIGNVTGSGSRIDALEPVEYEWKSNGTRTRGFLAHKFQEVYPQSVTGTKDAVDADGNPVYQAMQASTSEVIADLVAEIKSLRARVAQLESN